MCPLNTRENTAPLTLGQLTLCCLKIAERQQCARPHLSFRTDTPRGAQVGEGAFVTYTTWALGMKMTTALHETEPIDFTFGFGILVLGGSGPWVNSRSAGDAAIIIFNIQILSETQVSNPQISDTWYLAWGLLCRGSVLQPTARLACSPVVARSSSWRWQLRTSPTVGHQKTHKLPLLCV